MCYVVPCFLLERIFARQPELALARIDAVVAVILRYLVGDESVFLCAVCLFFRPENGLFISDVRLEMIEFRRGDK